MNLPINQHWVPKFYLKNFATPDSRNTKNPKVWIFSKDEKDAEPLLTNIRNVCAKRFLYSPIEGSGKRELKLESKLQGLESHLAQIWPVLANGYVDIQSNKSIRKSVALFVAVMYLRHPDMLFEVTSVHQRIVDVFDAAPKKADGTPDVDTIEINGKVGKISTSGWFDYRNWDANDHHKFFVDAVQSEATNIAELLLKKRWSVVCSDNPVFITTDKPASKQHQTKEKYGFGTEGVIINFPLSPTRLLVMDDMHTEPAGQYYPLKNDDPGSFNLMTWRNGSQFMISPRNIDDVLIEITEWANNYEKTL